MNHAQARIAGQRTARHNGHTLTRWSVEAGRLTAVCGCGGYVAVDRSGGDWVTVYGRLPIPGSVRPDGRCPRATQEVK